MWLATRDGLVKVDATTGADAMPEHYSEIKETNQFPIPKSI